MGLSFNEVLYFVGVRRTLLHVYSCNRIVKDVSGIDVSKKHHGCGPSCVKIGSQVPELLIV